MYIGSLAGKEISRENTYIYIYININWMDSKTDF